MGSVDELCVNTLRFLAVDQVEAAKSGHPGLPLGAAPMAYVLWDRFLRHNPKNPSWFNRDRFVLSAGHGSALLYSLLHLYGYDLPLEELKRFRQWGSRTPGHPEYGEVPGVEATTGPLGQGFAMGVGMAIAEAHLAAVFNRPGFDVVDHFTYALVSDGDLMEGVASEAASLAGHLKLGKLVYLYDDNHISIEGDTSLAFTEDVGARFEAYGWQVLRVADGNDLEAISSALSLARSEAGRPSLIVVRTHIGFGSPRQDTAKAHGEPLGPQDTRATKEKCGWPVDSPFFVPDEAAAHGLRRIGEGTAWEGAWEALLKAYRERHPELAQRLDAALSGTLPEGWEAALPIFNPGEGPMATRAASGRVLNALAPLLHGLIGGSADLAPSNNTALKGFADFSPEDPSGRNLHFGVREFAMAAAANGMALHGGLLPYAATFFIFSDYCRAAVRLSALMQTNVVYVFTHDSIGVGEDGPTHQPIGQLMSLRVIPGLVVLRPADANETAAAWRVALSRKGPTALALTRQNLPVLDLSGLPVAEGVPKGAYVLQEAEGGTPDVVLLGTGSEVSLAMEARTLLAGKGVKTRVVSMPSWELFDRQPEAYRRSVLPPGVPRVSVEAGTTRGWRDYVGDQGAVVGIDHFGASAPGKVLFEKFGFTAERVADLAEQLLKR
jgi:transketolase